MKHDFVVTSPELLDQSYRLQKDDMSEGQMERLVAINFVMCARRPYPYLLEKYKNESNKLAEVSQ